MSGFDERQQAFEKKYAHDAEMNFKADARRNKLLGLWLAPQLGKDDAEAYAKSVVVADLEEEGDEDVVRKVLLDIIAAGAAITEQELRDKMAELGAEAKAQVMAEV
ncbi:MAG: DUF1476 domain-containing protein [Pikeienuella sp.]